MTQGKTPTRHRSFYAALMFALFLVLPVAVAQGNGHDASKPLMVAADVGFAPFAYTEADGKTIGFSVDAANEIAKRLGRPSAQVVDVNFSAIFAGLFAGRYEFVVAPANITEERAKEVLYAEPYMETGLGFVIKADAELNSADELKGKTVSVNNGSVSDTWATENAEKYGFTVQRYDKNADGIQAVIINRAFANIADLPASQYAATQNDQIKVGFAVYNGHNFGYMFRLDDVDFRNQVECVVEGMKLDGTYAALHQKWFGDAPGPDTSMNKVWAGYGAAGFPGYTFEPHQPCFP